MTQAELARLTGLAPATVSSIVRDLSGFRELVETEPGSGRRGTTVRLARGAGIVAGIDFGHSHVAVAFGDLTGSVVAERRVALGSGHDWEDGLERARALLEGAAGRARPPARPAARDHHGPARPGHRRRGLLVRDPARLGRGPRRGRGQQALRAARHVENDANLGALAEHRVGVARGETSSVFIKISSGIGAGIIIDDTLHRGSSGAAGEIGHLTLDDQGPMCRCGSRGCLEAYASAPAVVAMMATQLPGAGIDDLVRAAEEGNVAAIRTFEDAGLHLGWGLASIVNLLNPALVVVGGDMARAGELLLEPARIGLRRHALDAVAATPVLASRLGERASLAGAVLQAAERTELALD